MWATCRPLPRSDAGARSWGARSTTGVSPSETRLRRSPGRRSVGRFDVRREASASDRIVRVGRREAEELANAHTESISEWSRNWRAVLAPIDARSFGAAHQSSENRAVGPNRRL